MQAVEDITGALHYGKQASPFVQGHVHTEAGLIFALAARTDTDRTTAFALFDKAAHLIPHADLEEDPHFLKLDWGFYHLRRAMAQTTRKSPTGLTDTLKQAQRLTPADLRRRQLIIDIVRAQGLLAEAAVARGPIRQEQCYAEAAQIATDALTVAKQLQSRLNRDRIEGIYQQLKASSYANDPAVIRLGWMLKAW